MCTECHGFIRASGVFSTPAVSSWKAGWAQVCRSSPGAKWSEGTLPQQVTVKLPGGQDQDEAALYDRFLWLTAAVNCGHIDYLRTQRSQEKMAN